MRLIFTKDRNNSYRAIKKHSTHKKCKSPQHIVTVQWIFLVSMVDSLGCSQHPVGHRMQCHPWSLEEQFIAWHSGVCNTVSCCSAAASALHLSSSHPNTRSRGSWKKRANNNVTMLWERERVWCATTRGVLLIKRVQRGGMPIASTTSTQTTAWFVTARTLRWEWWWWRSNFRR